MSVIQENQKKLEAALADLENVTAQAREINSDVRDNLAFAGDLTSAQKDFRLAKIDPFAVEIQTAFDAAKAVFQATDPIPDE